MLLAQLKENFHKIPIPVKLFLQRALLLITGWILLYHLVLRPKGIPDDWFTNITAGATAKLLTAWYHPATSVKGIRSADILIDNKRVLLIGDNCNALQLYILYTGFLLCVPTTKKRIVVFTIAGVASIFILNVLRCYALTWLNINKHDWVDFAHKYAFTFIVYLCIFCSWVWYCNKYEAKEILK